MNKKYILAAALTGLVAAGSIGLTPTAQAADAVKCQGANSCKGTGACGGKDHKCAGKNACKGKGWINVESAEACAKAGGTVVK